MAQDIRELFRQDQSLGNEKLPQGHKGRFNDLLEQRLPQQQTSKAVPFYQWAAVMAGAIGIAALFFLFGSPVTSETEIVGTPTHTENPQDESIPIDKSTQVTLADISPDFKKVEEYYLANLNLGLSKLNINEGNKALIDSFMAQLAELDQEYGRLNRELTEHGFSGETVEALIQNLQLRLDLLHKLNAKLDELKMEQNENYKQIQA